MSFLRKLKGSKHFLKKGDTFLQNIEDTSCFDLNQRDLIVYHIDSDTEGTFSLTVKNDDIGENVLDKVCDHYNLHDYREYFGLKYTLVDDTGDHEILWLDLNKQIGKQLKDTNNVLTFRVKHFPGKPQNIESEYVRYLIFLQIRNYLLKGDLQLALTEDIKLAAFAVQASLGDYDSSIHHGNYLASLKFLSRKSFKAEEKIMDLHKQLTGKNPAEMEMAFLEKASMFDTYGAELIVVKTSKGVPINFGVSHNGIITYLHGTPANIAKIDMFPWNQIGKISYEARTLKVHFHTPDRENSEIIKKQVMIFKCTNSRICKHLWKFILDQKAFFNFNRGVDVPKIKSSNRLFTLKSKFRFSGRCERELIAAQSIHDQSLFSDATLETSNCDSSTSTAFNSLNVSNQSDDSSQYTVINKSFKRRTFMPTIRSFVRPKHFMKPITSDTNNNELSVVASSTSINMELEYNKKLSPGIEKKSLPSEKANYKNLVSQEQPIEQLDGKHTTSTPHLYHKINIGFEDQRLYVKDGFYADELQETNLNRTSTFIHKLDESPNKKIFYSDSEDESDQFYEHDDYLKTNRSAIAEDKIKYEMKINEATRTNLLVKNNLPVANNEETGENTDALNQPIAKCSIYENHSTVISNYATLSKNLSYSLLIVFSILLIFSFFLIIIQHWKCTVKTSSIFKSSPNCNYQKTFAKLVDDSGFRLQLLTELLFNMKETNYFWPLDSNSTVLLDPLFNWFFDQYKKGS